MQLNNVRVKLLNMSNLKVTSLVSSNPNILLLIECPKLIILEFDAGTITLPDQITQLEALENEYAVQVVSIVMSKSCDY